MGKPRIRVVSKDRRTHEGVTYASGAECRYAEILDLDPEIIWWVRQPKFQLGDFVYTADFLTTDINGNVQAVEVKGMETERWRMMRSLWPKYGPIALRVVNLGTTTEIIVPDVPVAVDS